jgi:excisionase family DNA binding protein
MPDPVPERVWAVLPPEGNAMENRWMDADETAASLHITKATLYKLVKDGRVPARKVAGKWRFSREAIEDLFAMAATGPSFESGRKAGA